MGLQRLGHDWVTCTFHISYQRPVSSLKPLRVQGWGGFSGCWVGGSSSLCLLNTCACSVTAVMSDCSASGSSVHGIFPGKNTGVGCHALFQGICPTQGLNQHLLHVLHWRWILYPLSYWENPVTELPGKPWLLNSWLYFSSTSHKGFYYKARLENLRFDNLGCDLRQFLDYRSLG